MWVRIAAHFPVWYEPEILACFRRHHASETNRVDRAGTEMGDRGRTPQLYLSRARTRRGPDIPGRGRRISPLDTSGKLTPGTFRSGSTPRELLDRRLAHQAVGLVTVLRHPERGDRPIARVRFSVKV